VELQQLQHFLALARSGSITRTADDLGISPSGLSRSIKALEDFLALPLFLRQGGGHSRRQMLLTPFGEALLPHASHILDERARAIGELEALRSLRGGRVRVAINPVFDELVASQVIDHFTVRFPEVELDLWSGTQPELYRQGLGLDFDFGFSFFPQVRDENALIYEPLFEATVSVCTGGDCSAPPLALSEIELIDAEWVLLGADAFRRTFDDSFRARGLAPPRRMRLCSSLSLLRSLIAKGDRLTLLPRFSDGTHGPGLCAIDSFLAPLPVCGGVYYRRDASHGLAAAALLTAFRENFTL
jgi:DNA-binding transcriptional LysR family regulator